MVEADGSLTLLGRDSNCINTVGKKVYSEEVEEAVKSHPDVVPNGQADYGWAPKAM
ncbi:MAG: hypothetical protein ABGX04_14580 [Myxococcales bacterium]